MAWIWPFNDWNMRSCRNQHVTNQRLLKSVEAEIILFPHNIYFRRSAVTIPSLCIYCNHWINIRWRGQIMELLAILLSFHKCRAAFCISITVMLMQCVADGYFLFCCSEGVVLRRFHRLSDGLAGEQNWWTTFSVLPWHRRLSSASHYIGPHTITHQSVCDWSWTNCRVHIFPLMLCKSHFIKLTPMLHNLKDCWRS